MKETFSICFSAIFALGLVACNPDTSKQVSQSTAATSAVTPDASTPTADTTKPSNPDAPLMAFTETEFDFGTIKDGDVVNHTFKFTNTGKTPLIIQNATAPCGCTVPQWPKKPIAPGSTGVISVQFNSRGKSGQQNKVVTIIANTEPIESHVTMKGNVEEGVAAMNGPLQK
ncbi:MAG: DUF1573 domain-containing protein [Bacteroidota bacterium]